MKKITTTRKTNRRPAHERTNPSGAQNQLSKRRSKAASRKSKEHPNMDITLEQPISEEMETGVAEEPKETPAEFSRGQLGKGKRAFAKAGKEASKASWNEWLSLMAKSNIAVMDYSSGKLSKLIKGEITVSELLKQWLTMPDRHTS